MARLVKCFPEIVTVDGSRQHLISVDQFLTLLCKRFCHRSFIFFKYRQFHPRMLNFQ